MSDAACDQNSFKNNSQDVVGTSCNSLVVEEHWRKGIILVQIWREVLRVILFAGDPSEGLDEKSKREMWILLVAAGSGYLARCWHKTLKPKTQLADRPHDGDEDSQDHQDRESDDQRVGNNNDNKNLLLLTSSSSSSPQPVPAEKKEVSPLDVERIRKTPELAPKPLKRSFSPKAIGKKLFSSDGSKNLKASKKDGALSSLSEGHRSSASAAGQKESGRSILSGLDKSLFSQDASASVGHSGSSRRSPWSSFRSSSSKALGREGSPGPPDDDYDSSTESSPGCFKRAGRAGDSFRKNRDWRKSDTGSFSSRSLQSILGGDGGDGGPASAGSSRREMDPPDSLNSSSELTNRSFATPKIAEHSSEVGESPEATSKRQAAENEAKITSVSSSPDVINHSKSSTTRKEGPSSTSVAAVVARIEKGTASAKAETVNAILSIRAANQAQAQAQAQTQTKGQVIAVTDIVKARTLKLEVLEQESVEDEIVPGGKGKRRAGDGGSSTVIGTGGVGKWAGLSAPLSTGKRTKDSKDSGKSDSTGVTLTSITSKWRKDASFVPMEDSEEFGETSTSSGIGAVDLSQVFFGFDSTFLSSPAEEKSPLRFYRRSRQLNRSGRSNMRKMRESPRPMSALESCLRAQFPERDNEGSRVARSLNFFSSSVGQRGPQRGREYHDQGSEIPFPKDLSQSDSPRSSSDGRGGLGGGSEQQSPDHTEGAMGLPPLGTPPSTRRSASSGSRGFSSERGHVHLGGSASKYPRNVVFEDSGRVISSQSKLSDVLWRPTTLPVALKKRKVSQACSPSANSNHLQAKGYEMEALVVPPMEGLLFSFGVGIGVMSLVDGTEDKVEKLTRELQKSEEQIENLNNLLRQARESSVVHATLSKELVVADQREVVYATASLSKELVVADRISSEEAKVVVSGINESPLDPLSVTPAIEERSLAVTPAIEEQSLSGTPAIEETRRPFDLYRKEAPETPQLTDHMADLEAELEAELDALTSSITDGAGGAPDFEELDPEGVAGVADRDLGVEGLPAVVDWDDDNDDFITEEPAHSGGGVPPRVLSRLLRKVLNSRQEHHISELQADLHETVEKLQAVEKELQLLRGKAKSFAPLSAGTVPESPDSVARSVSESLVDSDNDSWSAQIERLNQSVFEDQESRREDVNKSGIRIDSSMGDTQKSSGEKSAASTLSRPGPGSNALESVASEPAHSTGRPVENDLTPHLPARAASEPVPRPGGSAASEFGASKVNESVSGQQDVVVNGVGSVPRGLAAANKTASSSQRSVSSLILSEEDRNSEAQADNDAVCDEFLSSVFCSPDGSLLGLSSAMSSPLMDQMLSNTPEEDSRLAGIPTDISLDMAVAVGDDLDQVVGQLLKRDSSTVKNAINAFLRWEAAETDDTPIKDDIKKEVISKDETIKDATRKDDTRKEDTSKEEMSKEETSKVGMVEEETTIGGYSRRTAGKNPTPQKTPVLSSVSSSPLRPQKPSVISARLEQLARSAFTSEKMPYVDKSVGNTRRRGPTSDEMSPRDAGKALEVFQQQSLVLKPEDKSPKPVVLREYPLTRKEQSPQTSRREEAGKSETAMMGTLRDVFQQQSLVLKPEDKSPKPVVLREYPLTRKEQSPQTSRREEARKSETAMMDTLRDMFRSDSPVFGGSERDFQVPVFGGSEKDFQTMLDTRRELRYSTAKVQLSLSGADTAPVFRQRDDPNRAGTNSPISGTKPPVKNAFQSPKVKHSRMAFENRLYQNPTSDWLSEVGSPPDM